MAPSPLQPAGTRASAAGRSLLALAAGAWAASSCLSSAFVSPSGVVTRAARDASAVARAAGPEPAPTKFGSYLYPKYTGYVYRRNVQRPVRLRLARRGAEHWPFYRIQAAIGWHKSGKSGKYFEDLGFWDPKRSFDEPGAFRLKADRAVYWLRKGAEPTDQVASFLDLAGIIRRLGPKSEKGEWEWRVDPNSGPEAPEGWKYDLFDHKVDWNNRPEVRPKRRPDAKVNQMTREERIEEARKKPEIEKWGFKGYVKVPLDDDVISETVLKSPWSKQFPNTELPIY